MLKVKNTNKNQLLILLLVVGFIIGIIYENVVSKNHIISTEIFSTKNLQRYLQIDVLSEKFLWYVAKNRVLFLTISCLLGCLKWKKLYVSLCLLFASFFAGVFCVSSVLQLGFKGLLLCFSGMFPHVLFYGLSYGMLFVYWIHYPKRVWNHAKTLFVILSFLLGILLEVYVNPIIVKFVIGL